jgi:hypothetical protein
MTAEEVAQKITALQSERAERLASADQHEREARADRARAMECKKESAEWATALNSMRVKQIIESDQQAAAKARAEAEAAEKRAKAKEKELEEALAKLAKPPETPPAS